MTENTGPHRRGPPQRARWFGWRDDVQDIADDVRVIQERLLELTERLPQFEAELRRVSGRPPPGVDPTMGEVDSP